jgi:cysteine desulfurase / selenocysteine lyase
MSATTLIDVLIGNCQEFPILDRWVFFNHAGVAPIPRRSAAAIVKYAGQATEDAYLESGWDRQIERLRRVAASLINATGEEMALVKNTSEGLSIVAGGMDWHEGDRIVTTAVEYPSNQYPWIDLQQRRGIELVRVAEMEDAGGARRVPLEAILTAADHPRTRLISLSHVEFGSGQRHDLGAVGRFCRERDIRFCVDAIQSVGVLGVDVRAMNIDYLSADGHKWMLGPEGAGIFFCRSELIEKTHPVLIGWNSVERPTDFDRIDYALRGDAARFECGTHNVPGLLGLKASIDLIASVGVDQIWQRVRALTDELADGLRCGGFVVASPRSEGEASGIVSFTRPGMDVAAVARKLKKQHRIELAVRASRLRCSPHFYNTSAQIRQLLDQLDAVQ